MCHEDTIVPLYPNANVWTCGKCGYIGQPHIVSEKVEYLWNNFENIENLKIAKGKI